MGIVSKELYEFYEFRNHHKMCSFEIEMQIYIIIFENTSSPLVNWPLIRKIDLPT